MCTPRVGDRDVVERRNESATKKELLAPFLYSNFTALANAQRRKPQSVTLAL